MNPLRRWLRRHSHARGPSEATRARLAAERRLDDERARTRAVQAETHIYRELAQVFIEIQQTNHLGQAAARVLRGGK